MQAKTKKYKVSITTILFNKMSTSRNKRAVIVGIFILVGVGLLVTIILVMGGQRKSFARTITVKALFEDVSGLQQGNNIWLAGVKVGTVRKISFNPDSRVLVSMSILSSMQPYIHKDAKAKIGSESLIGNKIVVLTEGSPESPVIQSGDILAIQPSMNTEDMMNTLQQNNKNLLAITTDLKGLTQGLANGQGSLGKIVAGRITGEYIAENLKYIKYCCRQCSIICGRPFQLYCRSSDERFAGKRTSYRYNSVQPHTQFCD